MPTVYEIGRYDFKKGATVLVDRLQLITEAGTLMLCSDDGGATPCVGTDVAAAIAATPTLRSIGDRQQAHITCGEDVAGQLPLLLEPVPSDSTLLVNGEEWAAFPTVEGNYVMLPGECDDDCTPTLPLWWAEYRCVEGGADFESQLVGRSSIGLLAPGVAVEHGRTDYGGNGGSAAVSVRPFDDFATLFVDWLERTAILRGFWHGDRGICSPDIELFTEAALAADRCGYWEEADGQEDQEEVDNESEESDWDDVGSFASKRLELHLSSQLVDNVHSHLSSLYPGRAGR